MSSNFLDVSGLFAGVDLHLYYTGSPPAPPVPVPNLHAVFAIHLGIQHRFWRVVTNVTTGHCPVLQSSWAMHLVPHIPIPLPPYPAVEGVNLACVWITSSSAPQLSAHSVTAKGSALLVEIIGPIGANCDCGLLPIPTNIDLNFNSVKTTPSPGDYAAAAVGFVLNGLLNTGISFIKQNPIGVGIAVFQYVGDALGIDPIAWLISKLQTVVQEAVD